MGRRRSNGRRPAPRRRSRRRQQVIDFTRFDNRRTVKIASQVTVGATDGSDFVSVQPVYRQGLKDRQLAAVNLFTTTPRNIRLVNLRIVFDGRAVLSGNGVPMSNPRCAAFLLNVQTNTVDESKLASQGLATYGRFSRNPLKPQTFNIRVGPEYSIGQFGTADTSAALILVAQGFQGTVKIISTVQTLGPPVDYSVDLRDDSIFGEIYEERVTFGDTTSLMDIDESIEDLTSEFSSL
jgi:hypothetical protein